MRNSFWSDMLGMHNFNTAMSQINTGAKFVHHFRLSQIDSSYRFYL